jgi:hypothetical protein
MDLANLPLGQFPRKLALFAFAQWERAAEEEGEAQEPLARLKPEEEEGDQDQCPLLHILPDFFQKLYIYMPQMGEPEVRHRQQELLLPILG